MEVMFFNLKLTYERNVHSMKGMRVYVRERQTDRKRERGWTESKWKRETERDRNNLIDEFSVLANHFMLSLIFMTNKGSFLAIV